MDTLLDKAMTDDLMLFNLLFLSLTDRIHNPMPPSLHFTHSLVNSQMGFRLHSVLLLLLVMHVSASDPDPWEDFGKGCKTEKDTHFCYNVANMDAFRHEHVRLFGDEGIVLDTSDDAEWLLHIKYIKKFNSRQRVICKFEIETSSTGTLEFKCEGGQTKSDLDVSGKEHLKIPDMSVRQYLKWYAIIKIKAGDNGYMPDALGLYADPKLHLRILIPSGGYEAPDIEPYKKCVPQTDVIGDLIVDSETIYCAEEGWRRADKSLIVEKKHARLGTKKDESKIEKPYCWIVVLEMFKDCSTHACYKFDGASKLTRVNDAAELSSEKIGVFVQYDSETRWTLGLAYEGTAPVFTIGEDTFDLGNCDGHPQVSGKVKAQCFKEETVGSISYKSFDMSATTGEDMMSAAGFYAGKPNVIKLKFKSGGVDRTYEGEGIANYPKYKKVGDHSFAYDSATSPIDNPDKDNVFTCSGNDQIFLNSVSTGVNEIRYTSKGWLSSAGDKKEEFADRHVFCYSRCKDKFISLEGTIKPVKLDQNEQKYSCNQYSVKVGDEYYESVACVNNEWKGDDNIITIDSFDGFTIKAECFGADSFVKDVSPEEKSKGYEKLQITNGVLSCADGYVLQISEVNAYSKICQSLRLHKGMWMDGSTSIGKVREWQEPTCYSKCAPGEVRTTSPHSESDSRDATYDWTQGTLKCADPTDVLIATLEDSFKEKEAHFGAVKCDPKNGWTEDGALQRDLKSITHSFQLTVRAQCYKACDSAKLTNKCSREKEKALSCAKAWINAIYKNRTLSCTDGYALNVNDKPLGKNLICSVSGWTNEGGSLEIDYKTSLKDELAVQCSPIPCIEYSPLNIADEKLREKFVRGSSMDSEGVECDSPLKMFHTTGDDAWSEVYQLKCSTKSEWRGVDPSNFSRITVFSGPSSPQPRVVCALTNPSDVPSTTTAPADPINAMGRATGSSTLAIVGIVFRILAILGGN